MKQEIKIGTRGSKLALWQANYVKSYLEKNFHDFSYQIKIIKTTGDLNLKDNLDNLGGRGVFVKEIQNALINKEIDVAIHSYKDLPTKNPNELEIISVSPREDERDVLISKNGDNFYKLVSKSIIGTGSNRRTEQLKILRDDLIVKPLRGNIDSRIGKVLNNELDAIVIAAAGINRLGLTKHISYHFDFDEIIPSPLQGYIAIESRKDFSLKSLFYGLSENNDKFIAKYESKALLLLNGSCDLPFGFNIRNFNSDFQCRFFLKSKDNVYSGSEILKKENFDKNFNNIIKNISSHI